MNKTEFVLLSSYLHCEWATLEQLEKDKRIHQKIKRFKTKHAQMRHIFQEVRNMLKPLILRCSLAACNINVYIFLLSLTVWFSSGRGAF